MFRTTICFALSIILANSVVSAQGFTGTISGTVKDESGAVLQGATVTAKHTETGLTRAAVTEASGNYCIPSLPVGAYEITAELAAFKVELLRGIDLSVAQEAVVNVTLQVDNVEQRVTVTGEPPLVNTTLASTSGLINEQQIKDMPLNGRSFDQLLTLNAGTSNNSTNVLKRQLDRVLGGWQADGGQRVHHQRNRLCRREFHGPWVSPSGVSGMLLGVVPAPTVCMATRNSSSRLKLLF